MNKNFKYLSILYLLAISLAFAGFTQEESENNWTKRRFGKRSLMMVNDKLLALSDKGKLLIVEAKPDAYEKLKSVQALEGIS